MYMHIKDKVHLIKLVNRDRDKAGHNRRGPHGHHWEGRVYVIWVTRVSQKCTWSRTKVHYVRSRYRLCVLSVCLSREIRPFIFWKSVANWYISILLISFVVIIFREITYLTFSFDKNNRFLRLKCIIHSCGSIHFWRGGPKTWNISHGVQWPSFYFFAGQGEGAWPLASLDFAI